MEMNEFAQKVCRAIEKELGKDYHAEVKEVRKNNGVLLHGLLILAPDRNLIPTIYLEAFHAAYEDGVSFGRVLDRILKVYREEMPHGDISMEFFKHFEKVKDKICYRLIRRQGNEKLLEEIPYVEFLDLAICFFYSYSSKMLGKGSILIYNSHMKLWDVDTRKLMGLAKENTPRLFPAELKPMTEMLEELLEMDEVFEPDEEIPVSVLSNSSRVHGAACILYPGMLEEVGKKIGKGFYIIPSSIHEVILMEDTGRDRPEELKTMIFEINRAHVAEEEVLSDNLYYYDYSQKKVKIIF